MAVSPETYESPETGGCLIPRALAVPWIINDKPNCGHVWGWFMDLNRGERDGVFH